MNDTLLKIVSQYLNMETNYAIIINGEYGTGKTHFFKNKISPVVKQMPLPKDERKKFTTIHISLFGLKTIEEIKTEIFVELYPILNNKNVKLAASIGKTIARGIIGDVKEYISDLGSAREAFINYDELILCFDDLDRKSDDLNIKDVFGFINSIVENQGAKVIIIANEKQLLKDGNYSSSLREKVIGISIQFKPNSSEIFDEIISKYKSEENIYYNFLSESKNRIVEIIEVNENNFRNLVFFLEHFKVIFYLLNKEFTENKSFAPLRDEKLNAVLNFTLAVSIEYKLGFINASNLKEIEELDTNPLARLRLDKFLTGKRNTDANVSTEGDNANKVTFIEIFKAKYYNTGKYYFFRSIFEYIIGLKAFDISVLISEINAYFIVKDGAIPESEQILNTLGYGNWLTLSDVDYRQLTKKMLTHAENGNYNIQKYSTIFYFALRHDNMLNLSIPRLKKRMYRGINKAKKTHAYVSDLWFHMSMSSDAEFKEHLQEIITYCNKVNEDVLLKQNEAEIKKIFSLFVNDHAKFLEIISDKHWAFRFQPFWAEESPLKIAQSINKLTADEIWHFATYISYRYRKNMLDVLYPEQSFLIELDRQINLPTERRKKKNLKNASLNNLSKKIKEAIGNFSSTA